jgi:hypothetical protein
MCIKKKVKIFWQMGVVKGWNMENGEGLTQFFERSLIVVPGPIYVWKPSKPRVTI